MKIKLDFKESEPYYFQEKCIGKEFFYIANLRNRCLFGYNAFELEKNAKLEIIFRGKGEGKIIISADRERRKILGKMEVGKTEEWTRYQTFLKNEKGTYKLYFTYFGEKYLDCLGLRVDC